MRPVAAQKERGHRLAQRRPRRKSNGRPIEGPAVGGDLPTRGINFDSPGAKQQKQKTPKGVFCFCAYPQP